MNASPSHQSLSARTVWLPLLLLWLAGIGLRLTILAVPPVIPQIHDELRLNATQVGILTGLPSMLLAFAAVPGSLLIARLGVLTALLFGLMLTAVGGALRGVLDNLTWLYALTIAMGAGVAIMQVTMPSAVRAWLPQRIGFATAVYTNGLLVGEILPVALMLPLVMPLTGGSWQWGFVVWSVPVVLTALAVLLLAPKPTAVATAAPRRRWWPDWTDPLIWKLGLMLGTVNAMYFGTNAFLPNYLISAGQGDSISGALTALNVGQLPASVLLLAFASRLELKAWPYVACGAVALAGMAAMIFGKGLVIVAAAGVVGFATAAILILALTLPPLLSAPDDVHRTTAAMFTISYSCAVVIPVLSGALWDLSGIQATAFLPIAATMVLLMVLAPAIRQVKRNGVATGSGAR